MPLNFAHRGSLTEAPENTLPAFQKAIDHGAAAIELDVQLTKDNHLVVSHDHKFTRFNKNVTGLIKDYTLEEIREIDVGSAFGEEFAGTSLPTLEEVLDICPESLFLNIEVKNIPVIYEGIEHILLDTLTAYQRTENLIISSFDHVALKKVQDMNPDIDLGMLFYYRMLRPWDYAANSGLNIRSLHPNQVYVDQTFVQESKRHGYEIYPFTVSDFDRYEELIGFGVDGVFSNEPGIFTK
ncbi:MAG TPA: glycerophosphodiester phosphodiesterase family protein [Lentibacillus sp.]|uniref:glycerophosphodiester phosphodiesterase n=1 Tax=Lentibacillus sp. TaxID=1925746 RepID=UPI002B4AB7A5|nr:glycerophosphodiester phosphodiesterase family protein [Lentibacillus sp.]HLR62774.1 glycerophosphodiester phosphodiesterase family protein [Lentibacillus sp.]